MKPATADVPLRLRSPADIVEAVPYLLGFQPEDSLVVLSLRNGGSLLGLTARVDLPRPAAAVACAREFVDFLERDHATRAIIVIYPPSGGPDHASVEPIAEAMTDELMESGIDICEVVCVCDGRWWSLFCTNEGCCPPEGTPVDRGTTSANAAAMTFQGRVALESREELARTIDPVNGVAQALMAGALPRAQAQRIHRIGAGQRDEFMAETLDLFRAAIRGRCASDADAGAAAEVQGVDDIARLIVGLLDKRARDELLTWYEGDRGAALRGLLVEMVRRGSPSEAAPLTTLAWIAYLQGDGAFAGIVLDRALAADPGYRLAVILDEALVGGLNPDIFRASTSISKKPAGRSSTRRRRGR